MRFLIATLKPLCLLVLALQWTPALAILGGDSIPEHQFSSRIHTLDVRLGDKSIVCTASSVSPSHILTAAHCFGHLIESQCLDPSQKCQAKLLLNKKRLGAFKVHVHPKFSPQSKTSENYLNSTNFDVAIVQVAPGTFQDYFPMAQGDSETHGLFEFFGRGMSQIKMVSVAGEKSYLETQRGSLKKIIFSRLNQKNGLIRNKASTVLLNSPLRIELEGQILRSDSGGPLLNQRSEIIGVARNYTLSEKTFEASGFNNGPSFMGTKPSIQIQSYFTAVNHKEILTFIQKKMAGTQN